MHRLADTADSRCAPSGNPLLPQRLRTDGFGHPTPVRPVRLAGIGRDRMYEYVNSRADPIPQMRVGRAKTLIRTSAIPDYLRRRETA